MRCVIAHGMPTLARAARHHGRVSVLVACLAMTSTAHCAAQVSGSPQAVSVNAQNSSLKEILVELGKKFNLHVESSANLDKQLTGNYQGSLQRVVSRLLESYNFIIRTDQAGLDVTVFGTENGPGGSAPLTVVAANGVAARPTPTASRVQAHTTASATSTPVTSAATPHGVEVHPVAAKLLSLTFHVAEGPSLSPSPTPSATSISGLTPVPATGTMPKPTPSTATMPTPIGAPTPFPMVRATNTSAPSATTPTTPTSPTPLTPTPQTPTTK